MNPSLILVVEDHEVNRELVEDLLTVAGFTVAAFASGEEGLAWLESHRPDLIVMDINLPGRDGLSLTRELKSRPDTAAIPVVALTAYAMKGDRDRILAAGCDGYISKPIDVQQFPAQIGRFLPGDAYGPEEGGEAREGAPRRATVEEPTRG
jgi:CheY-like chemotaxis protein